MPVQTSSQDPGVSPCSAQDHSPIPEPQGAVRFGLAAIKNVGRAAVDMILRARGAGGPFASLLDFCHRVMGGEAGGVSRSTIEALVQCGAFARLPGHGNRRALMQILDDALQSAAKAHRDKKAGQVSLADMFGDGDAGAAVEAHPIPHVPEYPRDQLLGFERDLLGLYVSDHPLQAHLPTFEKRSARKVSDLAEMPDRADVLLGGILTSIKPFTSKKSGEPMAFFTLEDMTGTVSCTLFPSAYAQQSRNLEKDRIVLLRGKTSHRERVRDDDEGGHIVEILAEEIMPLAGGAGASGGPSKIILHLDPSKRDVLRFVRETLEQNRGNGNACPIHLRVPDGGRLHEIRTELLAEFTEPFRAALERLLGKQSVWLE
jgi:DNA polymerase-3 subunit alpha